jgi:hypothetical protein
MKKLTLGLTLILAALLPFAGFGCSKSEYDPGGYPTALPNYEHLKADSQMAITAFNNPPTDATQYQWMSEAGFNRVLLAPWMYNCIAGNPALFKAVELADQYGIKSFPMFDRDNLLTLLNADMAANNYSGIEGFGGYYVDEPLEMSHFNAIDSAIGKMRGKYPDKKFMVTLTTGAVAGFETYDEVVDYLCEITGDGLSEISADYYPLRGNALNYEVGDAWLVSLETTAQGAKKAGKDFHFFIASMSINSQRCRHPYEADLRYQAYTALAYGARGIEYFTYMSVASPPYTGEFRAGDWALIRSPNDLQSDDVSTYYRTETYYAAQNLNTELLSYDHVLLAFDWQGTIQTAGADAQTTAGGCFEKTKNALTSHPRIKSISASEDLITGTFKDKNGYDGFMAVNFADSASGRSNDVKISFNHARKAVVYTNGVKSIIDLNGGVYESTLDAGEGRFIIPIA